MDRTYFHSIYFREPGGVLFEIATDNPGFTADQTAEELGTKLMLPPWLESHRAQIERTVPTIKLPSYGRAQRHHDRRRTKKVYFFPTTVIVNDPGTVAPPRPPPAPAGGRGAARLGGGLRRSAGAARSIDVR